MTLPVAFELLFYRAMLSSRVPDQAREFDLRDSGTLEVTQTTIRIHRPQEESVTIAAGALRRVSLKPVAWDRASLGALVVLFGAYFAATTHLLGRLAFVAVGAWSLVRTYRDRSAVYLWVDGAPEAIVLYPHAADRCHATLTELLQAT